MTEREKMFAGKIYDPFTEGMPEQRTNAHRLCALYNGTTEIDEEKRKLILDELKFSDISSSGSIEPHRFDTGTQTTESVVILW